MAPPPSTMLRGALLSGEVREKHARSDDCNAKWFAEDEKIIVSADNEAGSGCQSASEDGVIINIAATLLADCRWGVNLCLAANPAQPWIGINPTELLRELLRDGVIFIEQILSHCQSKSSLGPKS